MCNIYSIHGFFHLLMALYADHQKSFYIWTISKRGDRKDLLRETLRNYQDRDEKSEVLRKHSRQFRKTTFLAIEKNQNTLV